MWGHKNYPSNVPRCYCCGRKLKSDNTIWLELNSVTNRWRYTIDSENKDDWGNHSQGGFEFGPTCARRVIAQQGGESTEAVPN